MKQIFFIRHAKSSWKDGSLKDIDRPLNKRGRRDAAFMAKKLADVQPQVELIICSPARRAQETCSYFMSEIECNKKILDDNVYHAWTATLIEVMRGIENHVQSAFIFGHNPGFTSVFNHFSKDILDNLPTCGIFELKTTASWSDISSANTKTGLLIYPKLYLNEH